MVLMILTVFSLFVLVGVTIANLVILCAMKRTASKQLLSTLWTNEHMGKLMRKTMDSETFDTSSDIQKELEKIMSYTGVDHGQ